MTKFTLAPGPLAPVELSTAGAGGFVMFDGRVRDSHRGRTVVRLEYEAYSSMAESEGLSLVNEAAEKFGLLDAVAQHRTGVLEVGDSAVLIQVSAPHRAEAFAGCAFIIDELKKRVPIWKKEHYADGDSGWVSTDEPVDGALSGDAECH